MRTAAEDCILPRGGGIDGSKPIFVRKGTDVNYIFRSMHYDKDLWGEDAGEFKPERWEDSKENSIPTRGYIPFGIGTRVCPAKQMATGEIAYILARLMREFKTIQNRDEEERFIERHKMAMESRNGVQVAFTANA